MSKLLTREEASKYIGIDPKTFDKVFRSDPDFKRFKLGELVVRLRADGLQRALLLPRRQVGRD